MTEVTVHRMDDRLAIYAGDCRDALALLPDACVDAVVTDPPYELGFMGKGWDGTGVAYDSDLWRECLRVLKPGGHLLSFGGTRTWHRLAVAIEDAGFEVRDSIAWLYGSGFPKSLDVSKAIDKARDDKDEVRVVCRAVRSAIDVHPSATVATIADEFGFNRRMVEHWAARDTDSQPTLPTWEQWEQLRDMLNVRDAALDAEVWRLNGRKGAPGDAWRGAEVVGEHVGAVPGLAGERFTTRDKLMRAPATDAARRWQGWGTALKPAFEPVVVARKPLVGTVAANVLAHGVGALNVDGCRIEGAGAEAGRTRHGGGVVGNGSSYEMPDSHGEQPAGRWPANVTLDEAAAAELDEQSGTTKSKSGGTSTKALGVMNDDAWQARDMPRTGHDDTGGASRFFYVAKAPTKERPKVDGVAHPTVKPLALMRWLVRLVTPPGGIVLDPFAGSGTTVEAALGEGFRVIACELTPEYLPLIDARIARAGVVDEGVA